MSLRCSQKRDRAPALTSEIDGAELFHIARKLSPEVAYFVPRNTDPFSCLSLLSDQTIQNDQQQVTNTGLGNIEFEEHIVDSRTKTCCAYFGDLLAKRTLQEAAS